MTFFIMLYVFNALEQPGPVPHRLVRRVAVHADTDHPRHPHQQDPVPPEPGQPAAYADVASSSWSWARPLTVSPLAPVLGFVALPGLYWPLLAGMLIAYVVLTQAVKVWFIRRFPE